MRTQQLTTQQIGGREGCAAKQENEYGLHSHYVKHTLGCLKYNIWARNTCMHHYICAYTEVKEALWSFTIVKVTIPQYKVLHLVKMFT